MLEKPNPLLAEICNSLGIVESPMTYESFSSDPFKLICMIEKGISAQSFIKLKSILPFSSEEWASFLNISAKSLRHIENDAVGKTNPEESERIMELAEVSCYGIEVFGTKAKFYAWVKSPSVDLNGKRPLDILSCSYGKQLVIDLIGRIEHGIFA